jgi:membrane-bound ClpP family serine protease|tara:strand:+ start:318 stop:563 length:246 start_codon:yes stop_codon:yes gene_type:complete
MWTLLAVYGIVTILSSIFLVAITGVFGMVIGLMGVIMLVLSAVLSTPESEQPDDQSKKYCEYCIAEINKTDITCPICQTEQ